MIMTAAVAGSLALSASVQATTISMLPGAGGVTLSGATNSVSGGATLLANETSTLTFLSGTGIPDVGTVQSWVYSGDANNTLNGLTFVYQVSITSGEFDHLVLDGYGFPSVVNVGYNTLTGSLLPTDVSRTSGTGNPLDFDWGSEVNSVTTYLLIVNTSIAGYANNIANLSDGETYTAAAYAPNLPDGGVTAMLLGGALSAMGLLRRKLIA